MKVLCPICQNNDESCNNCRDVGYAHFSETQANFLIALGVQSRPVDINSEFHVMDTDYAFHALMMAGVFVNMRRYDFAELIMLNGGNATPIGWGWIRESDNPLGRLGMDLNEFLKFVELAGVRLFLEDVGGEAVQDYISDALREATAMMYKPSDEEE